MGEYLDNLVETLIEIVEKEQIHEGVDPWRVGIGFLFPEDIAEKEKLRAELEEHLGRRIDSDGELKKAFGEVILLPVFKKLKKRWTEAEG